MPSKTTVARARLRAHILDIDIYFDTIFKVLEADATQCALDVFGHGYSARIRTREGSLLVEAAILTGSVLTFAGGITLGTQKFLVDYPKMKDGLAIFLEDARKFAQTFRALFATDTNQLPIEELSFEAEAPAPEQLLEFVEAIMSIGEARTVQERHRQIENSYAIAKALRTTLSERDKEQLLSLLSTEHTAQLTEYKALILSPPKTYLTDDEHVAHGAGPRRVGERTSIPRRRTFNRSKTINL